MLKDGKCERYSVTQICSYVRHFSSSKVRCIKDYVKPFLREISDHFVFYVETNNLDLERQPELIVRYRTRIDIGCCSSFKK